MVNNYPEYAAGVNFKKTDSNDVTHFYSAQVVADPSDDTITSKLIKDGVAIVEMPDGGSSDFSTAEVTITGLPDEGILNIVYLINDVDLDKEIMAAGASNDTITAVLYQGYQYVYVEHTETWTVTGSASIDPELYMIVITGDCQLTFNGIS